MLLGSLYRDSACSALRPTHDQYKRYWKVIEEFLIYKELEVSQGSKQAIHKMLKVYCDVDSIASENILKSRLTKYINQCEMLLAREHGFVLGDTELNFKHLY